MTWKVFVDQYLDSRKYDPLARDAVPRIVEIARMYLQNTIVGDKDVRARCPFHATDASSQTLRINLDPTSKYGIGFVHCHSCKKNGHFNVLAEHLGVDLVHGEANPEFRNMLRTPKVDSYEYRGIPAELRFPMPTDYSWYREKDDVTISRNTLEIVGAELWRRRQAVPKRDGQLKIVVDERGRPVVDCYVPELRIWMPVLEMGIPVAHVAALDGRREWYSRKYLNSKGDWPKKYVWPFEQVRRAFPGQDTLVIVEGPADALRLIDHGVAAVANLGVSAWTAEKAELVACHYARVLVCLDSDSAGQGSKESIKQSFDGYLPAYTVGLKGGKDVAAMPQRQLDQLIHRFIQGA